MFNFHGGIIRHYPQQDLNYQDNVQSTLRPQSIPPLVIHAEETTVTFSSIPMLQQQQQNNGALHVLR